MRPTWLDRNFSIVTVMTIAVILYGSLYPFAFYAHPGGVGPVLALIESWDKRPGYGDFLSNILLYIPLGFFGAMAIVGKAGAWKRMGYITCVGAVLSAAVELTQYYDFGRDTEATDFYSNTLGTAIGSVGGCALAGSFRWPFLREISANRVPTVLIASWLGYRLYPYVPTIDLHKYWYAVKPILLTPSLTGYEVFHYTAMWLAIAALIEAIVGYRRALTVILLFAGAVFFAKILIITTTLKLDEIAGAGLAYCVWMGFARAAWRSRAGISALFLLAYVVAWRLEPFEFTVNARPFGWIPFLSLMQGSINVDVMAFLEKFFLYGGSIWLLAEAGLRLRPSALVVTILLFMTSWAETYLPGRSAEITDAMIALVSAGILSLLTQDDGKGRASIVLPVRRPLPASY